jgi:CMP-N,N'-diacetyllegionaminic acid synthase
MSKSEKGNIIALIPARGGSQRVKGKNIRELGGKPLIAYTIEAALAVKNIDRVIVSTDNDEIADIAMKHGAEVPFLRPPELSTSDATEYAFHAHAVDTLQTQESYQVDMIVNLYPTTPFRKQESISRALDIMLEDPNADSLRSVRKCKEHPYKMWVKNGSYLNRFVRVDDPSKQTLSYHLLPEVYIQNASIYIVRKETLVKYQNTIGENVICFEMDDTESIDINYDMDFLFASHLVDLEKAGYKHI